MSSDDPSSMSLDLALTEAALKPKQLAALAEVKSRLAGSGVVQDTTTLIRFCVARNFDVDKTELMLKEHLEWRAATFPLDPAEFAEEPFVQACAMFPHGHDKENRPILVIRSGNFCPAERDLERSMRYCIYMSEKMLRESEEKAAADHSSWDGKFVLVYDRQNFSMSENLDKAFLKAAGAVFGDHYPERLHRVLVFPCGMILRGLWAVVQYFFDARTRAKVRMLGGEADFLEFVSTDQLLVEQGGSSNFTPAPPSYTALEGKADPWSQPGGGGGGKVVLRKVVEL